MKSKFQEFFDDYYKQEILELRMQYPKKRSLYIDYRKLEEFDTEIADLFVNKPYEVIEEAEEALSEMNIYTVSKHHFKPHIRIFNFPPFENIADALNSGNLEKVVAIKGVVNRRAESRHKMIKGVFKCKICEAEFVLDVGKNFKPPKKCPACKRIGLENITERSTFIDVQKAEVQELLEKVRGGEPAAKIELWLEDDLVNSFVPGDNIEVVGVLKLKEPTTPINKREMVFGRYIDVISIKKLKKDFEELEITKEDEKKIIEFSKRPDVVKVIVDSVAPAIHGYEEVKHAIALQLFGGTKGKKNKSLPIRDDIHILLIGDPGIAKTRFLQSALSLAPKSIYVSGKSVSGAGLTVSAEKDELGNGGWTLKAGALVLASGGMAGIDEFDKIDEEDRSSLHEAMETQTVSVAKAGITATFRTKTALLCAANPRFGRFNPNKSLADQFNIPPSLLSRFDLIFPIIDVVDLEKDARLAEHILNAHYHGLEEENTEEIREFLRKYIAYARRNIRPKLTKEAMLRIKEYYLDLRERGKNAGTVAITPRYIEGLVRLSEASAKMRLSEEVKKEDAEVATKLMDYVMEKIMTDRETGKLDAGIIDVGIAKSKIEKGEIIFDIIKQLCEEFNYADEEKVLEIAKKDYDIEEKTAKKMIQQLIKSGQIFEPSPGRYHNV